MVTGLEKKTNLPLPQQLGSVRPGDSRIYRPTKYDVLCGRGAPIQNHGGNIRMRKIVSRYTRRYMQSRKYRKQLIAEEAVQKVKLSESGKIQARFLRRVGRENFWEEVDDKIACDKVSHALRCFVRKLEDGGSISEHSDIEETDDEEVEEEMVKSSSSVPKESSASSPIFAAQSLLKSNAAGIRALQNSGAGLPEMRMLQFHTDPFFPSHQSLRAGLTSSIPSSSAMLPSMLGTSTVGNSAPKNAAAAELDFRISIHQAASAQRLMEMVARERAHLHLFPHALDPLATSFASNAALASVAQMEMDHSTLLRERLLTQARMRELLRREDKSTNGSGELGTSRASKA
eukprot:scaffold408_cov71-Cylindrotheca_fusiformis.AAC.6